MCLNFCQRAESGRLERIIRPPLGTASRVWGRWHRFCLRKIKDKEPERRKAVQIQRCVGDFSHLLPTRFGVIDRDGQRGLGGYCSLKETSDITTAETLVATIQASAGVYVFARQAMSPAHALLGVSIAVRYGKVLKTLGYLGLFVAIYLAFIFETIALRAPPHFIKWYRRPIASYNPVNNIVHYDSAYFYLSEKRKRQVKNHEEVHRSNPNLTEKEIKKGWSGDPIDYNTTCPKCDTRFVSHLIIQETKPPKPKQKKREFRVEYLCPEQTLHRMKKIKDTRGRIGIKFLSDHYRSLYYNIVRHFGTYKNSLVALKAY